MERKLEFYISGVVTGASGFLHLIGRNCEGSVRVGDIFRTVYRYAEAGGPSQRVHEKPVALTVAKLHAYEKDLDELQPGMTGRVSLTGTGGDEVGPGCLLGGVAVADNAMRLTADTSAISSESSTSIAGVSG